MLWNPKDREYSKIASKTDPLGNIALSLGRSSEDYINKMTRLLSSHRREKTNVKNIKVPEKVFLGES